LGCFVLKGKFSTRPLSDSFDEFSQLPWRY
jgi:hypothetical protein